MCGFYKHVKYNLMVSHFHILFTYKISSNNSGWFRGKKTYLSLNNT